MLLIAVTRPGSISHLNPAAEASSKTLRVTCKGMKHLCAAKISSFCSKELHNARVKSNLNLMHHFILILPDAKKQKHSQRDNDLCFAFQVSSTICSLRSSIKSAVGVFVLTHRFWSCPISGFMHGWPVWAECFHWCGWECRAAAVIRVSLTEAWAGCWRLWGYPGPGCGTAVMPHSEARRK